MSLILALETATPVCSVALAHDGKILSMRESSAPNTHSSLLTVFIEELFREASLHYSDLDAISVSMGPGSYTGLRIGVATAKGLCYALEKPLIAVPTLEAMAEGMRVKGQGSRVKGPVGTRHASSKGQASRMKGPVGARHASSEGQGLGVGEVELNAEPGTMFCPMIDARRMEVYCTVFDESLKEIRPTVAMTVDEHSFDELLAGHSILFAGTGADKCREVLSHQPNALFLNDFQASARFMIKKAEESLHESRFENLAYFEPFYLKDFIAGKPKVKGLT